MQTTNEFLSAVQQKHGIPSDNQLSIFLGCTRSAISGYRNGRSCLDDEIALKVSAALDLEPAYVIACIHAEREKNAALKSVWERIATYAQGAAVVGLVMALLPWVDTSEMGAQNAAFVGAISFGNRDLRDKLAEVVYYVKLFIQPRLIPPIICRNLRSLPSSAIIRPLVSLSTP